MRELIQAALRAREQAYTPYSHFAVGAALLSADGAVYTGCNVENAAFSPTCCAERVALFKAVSEGARHFTVLCVLGGPEGAPPRAECTPCGVCRQALREFCDPETFRILLAVDETRFRTVTLSQLLPDSFGPDNLR